MLCPGVQATQQRYDMSITTTPHGRGQPTRFDSILGAEEVIEDLILNLGAAAATKAFILMLKTGFWGLPHCWPCDTGRDLTEQRWLNCRCCMLATYTRLMRPIGTSLMHGSNLQVLWGLLDRAWGCMWATGDSLFRGLCFCVGFTTSLKERIRRIPDILCGMLIMVYLFILLIHLFTYLLIYLFTDLFIYLFMCFGASKPETNIVRPHEPSHAVLLCLARWSVRSLKTGTCSRPCSAGNDVFSNFSHHKPSPEG